MELVVMDKHDTRMQATVRMALVNQFKDHLEEGSSVTLQRYSLREIQPKYQYIFGWGDNSEKTNPDRGSNKGLPHFCSPPLVSEQGKKKLINQLSPAAYLHPWYEAASIPRHAVHLWLVIKRKLKTQDSLRQWDVWEHLKRFTGMANMPSALNLIVDFLIPLAKMRSARSVIAKLVFAASCYFIWQERNYRIFMKKKRSQHQVIDIIMSTVRLKLLTCRFKKTRK
ncbi:hypothetical protein Tco_1181579 [Tanacetum coccineum]